MIAYRVEIVTRIERNKALTLINAALSKYEGWIVHHQLFSNISAAIIYEMPSVMMDAFIDHLNSIGFNAVIEETGTLTKKDLTKEDIRGSITITFIHTEADLKRDVPHFG